MPSLSHNNHSDGDSLHDISMWRTEGKRQPDPPAPAPRDVRPAEKQQSDLGMRKAFQVRRQFSFYMPLHLATRDFFMADQGWQRARYGTTSGRRGEEATETWREYHEYVQKGRANKKLRKKEAKEAEKIKKKAHAQKKPHSKAVKSKKV